MVRFFGFLVGLLFVLAVGTALSTSVYSLATEPAAESPQAVLHKHPEPIELASNGWGGTFNRQQAQRGFQVYKEVCSNCHSLSHVAFRDLTKLGYTEAEVKKIAADWSTKQPVQDPKTGDRSERPNTPADHFPIVYYPGQGNPPDLSLITKARHGGAAYVHALLTGYAEQTPELLKRFPEVKSPDGTYYNPYFANLNIAMPPPLTSDGQVTYADGTKATVDQMSKDVAAFLVWTAEPELEARHQAGFAVIGFLMIATLLAFAAYRNIWRNVKH